MLQTIESMHTFRALAFVLYMLFCGSATSAALNFQPPGFHHHEPHDPRHAPLARAFHVCFGGAILPFILISWGLSFLLQKSAPIISLLLKLTKKKTKTT